VAAGVIVGPSRYLPRPLHSIAHRSWDEAALWYRRFRHALPEPVTQALAGTIELVQRPRLATWKTADQGPRLLVASNDPLLLHVLTRALAGTEYERCGSIRRLGIRPDSTFDAEVVAVEIPTARAGDFAGAGWIVLPRWVAMEVDLRTNELELWDTSKRETVRRIERSDFELEVARGRDDAREFHRLMYAPTARARHGATAIVVRPGFVDAAIRSGFVLFVRHGGARRAGLLLVPRPGKRRVLDAFLSGVAQGDYADTGLAREAAYLFAIRWARDVYCASHLGLTGAAPFVRDGILRYKRRWGATALADLRQPGCIALRVNVASSETCRALSEQPPIVLVTRDARPSLNALALHSPGAPFDLPATPGVEVTEIEYQSPAEVPRLLEKWAHGSSPLSR
jgi:hypothetical protein